MIVILLVLILAALGGITYLLFQISFKLDVLDDIFEEINGEEISEKE